MHGSPLKGSQIPWEQEPQTTPTCDNCSPRGHADRRVNGLHIVGLDALLGEFGEGRDVGGIHPGGNSINLFSGNSSAEVKGISYP